MKRPCIVPCRMSKNVARMQINGIMRRLWRLLNFFKLMVPDRHKGQRSPAVVAFGGDNEFQNAMNY